MSQFQNAIVIDGDGQCGVIDRRGVAAGGSRDRQVINKDVAEHAEIVSGTLRRTNVAVEEFDSERVKAMRKES